MLDMCWQEAQGTRGMVNTSCQQICPEPHLMRTQGGEADEHYREQMFAEDCQSGCIGIQGGPLEDDLGVYTVIR